MIVTSPERSIVGRGSTWRRWEPHIHTPGTILNDQFGGPQAWDQYLSLIEQATPAVQALGVTDYWTLDRYTDVLAHKVAGRLAGVALIFANVELRLAIRTASGAPLNAHTASSRTDRASRSAWVPQSEQGRAAIRVRSDDAAQKDAAVVDEWTRRWKAQMRRARPYDRSDDTRV